MQLIFKFIFSIVRVGNGYSFSLFKVNDFFVVLFFVLHEQSLLENVLRVFWKNCILSALDRIFLSEFASIIVILIP